MKLFILCVFVYVISDRVLEHFEKIDQQETMRLQTELFYSKKPLREQKQQKTLYEITK